MAPQNNTLDSAIDSVLGDMQSETQSQVSGNLQAAVGTNADQEANHQTLAAVTGTPVETVRDDPTTAKKQLVAQQASSADLAARFPHTARFLTNVDNAMLAHDDVDNLSNVEYQFTAKAAEDRAKYGSISTLQGPEPGVLSIAKGLAKSVQTGAILTRAGLTMQMADLFGADEVSEMSLREAGQARLEQAAADPEFKSSTASGLYQGGTSLLQNAPGIAASVATMSPVPGLALAGVQTESEAYTRYRGRGASGGQAFLGAAGEGAIEVGTEMLPMGFIVDKLGKVGAGEFLKGFLGRELAGEELATLTQDALDTAIANPDKTWGEYIRERPEAAYQTALATLMTAGALEGVNHGARYMARGQTAAKVGNPDTIQAINDAAVQSKLRTRDPLAFQKLVENASKDSDVENLYISPIALAQSGVNPDELAALAPTVASQLAGNPQTGTDIRIPTAEFATHVAGTPIGDSLLDHLKTDPNGFSRAEATEFYQKQGENLQAEVQKVLKEKEGDDAFKQSRQAVQDTIVEQLGKANRFTADVNTPYATLMSNIYATMAARVGQTPEEFYKAHPITINAEVPTGKKVAGRQLSQMGTEWSQVLYATKLPEEVRTKAEAGGYDSSAVWLHGTRGKNFKKFKAGKGGVDELGKGLYLTKSPTYAQAWAKGDGARIIPAFIKKGDIFDLSRFRHADNGQPLNLGGVQTPDSERTKIKAAYLDIAKRIQANRENLTNHPLTKNGWMDAEAQDLADLIESNYARSGDMNDYLAAAGYIGAQDPYSQIHDQVVIFDPKHIKSIFNKKFDPTSELFQSAPLKTDTAAFRNWFKGSKVVDAEGKPLVVYHGTTADFSVFDRAKGNVESDVGRGFYFTNEPNDVGENYAGEGPDLTQKIQLEAERIASETDREYDDPEVVKEARDKFVQHNGVTMPVYLSFQNPVELGGPNPTRFDMEEEMDDEGEPTGEVNGTLPELLDAIRSVASDFNADGDAIADSLMNKFYDQGEVTANDVFDTIKTEEGGMYAEDPETGQMASGELFRAAMEYAGFDGIIDHTVNEKFGSERKVGKAMEGMEPGTTHYIAFHPEQIKSAVGNNGNFDPSDPNILHQDGLGLVSKAAQVAEQKLPNTGTPEQMLQNLEAYARNGDIKAEELEWSGVREWLKSQEGKVSKADVATFLREGGVKLEEVALTREVEMVPDTTGYTIRRNYGEYNIVDESRGVAVESFDNEADALAALPEYLNGMEEKVTDNTKFSKYTLPGGTNYREVLMTLPAKKRATQYEVVPLPSSGRWGLYESGEKVQTFPTEEAAKAAAARLEGSIVLVNDQTANYRSSHYDEPNILAHFRLDDRTDADGKKMLFIEEIQSDWHQTGRKKGYSQPEAESKAIKDWEDKLAELKKNKERAAAAYEESKGSIDWSNVNSVDDIPALSDDSSAAYKDFEDAAKAIADHQATRPFFGGRVPDAPFKKTWQELALKRILAMAVQGGYDRIGWTTGEQQAARYDLSKQINAIYYEKNENGTYNIAAHKDGDVRDQGTQVMYEEDVDLARIEELVGKDIAQRIADEKGVKPKEGHRYGGSYRDWRALSGLDLKVGGEGMQGFYDQILPKAVDKLVKKWGGKSGRSFLSQSPIQGDQYPFDVVDSQGRRHGSFKTEEQAKAAVPELEASKGNDGESQGFKVVSNGYSVHSLDLTPALREGVSKGLELFQNAAGGNRGAFNPSTNTLSLLKNADLSTFLHETGHFMLEMLNHVATSSNAPAEIKADMDAVLQHFKVEGATPEERLANWNLRDLEAKRESHELFARSFEGYIFEGKAPSTVLKEVFQRFRSWLLNIYRQLTALNAPLTDEVRGVFDRMLATSDQIKEAEALRNYAPMFATAQEANMTDDEFKAYHSLGVQATQDALTQLESRTLRDMKWLSNAKSRELKRLQRDAAGKRKAVREEVTAEVMAEPVNRALQFIKKGTLEAGNLSNKQRKTLELAGLEGTKLSLPELKDMYGDLPSSRWRDLPRGLTSEDGLPVSMVAELFGYSSGDQLIQALASASDPRSKIDALTDLRMLERYGDITDKAALERAAEEAIHNEARTKFIAAEMNALNKAIGGKKVLAEAAKGYAEQMVGRQRVRDVKPAQYTSAESRAAKQADAARKKGDLPAAAKEKRNQLINNYAAKAAYEALSDVEKALRYFAKFNREGTRSNIDVDYLDQIDQLLERFDLRRSTTLKGIDKRASLLEWVAAQEEKGFTPDIPPELLKEARKTPYKMMTVEQMRGLVDTVKQIEHIGRLKERLLTAQKQRDFETARDEIVNGIMANAPAKDIDLRTRSNAGGEILQGANRFLALHRKMASIARQMDGGKDGGPMWQYFVRSMNAAGDKEASMRAEATAKMHELIKPLLSTGRFGGKGTYFPSVGMSLNREERIGIALNTGNASNMQRLLDGEGWTAAQLQPVLDSITPAEAEFVQGVWDFFEGYRPQVAAKERRIYGKEPEWIQAQPIKLGGKDLRGGYYPVKYDPQRSGKAQSFAEAEDAKAMLKGAFTAATTRRSYTKARAEEVKGRPLLYSMSGLFQGTTEVIHDLNWHEWLIDVNKLLRSKAIDNAIRSKYGAETVSLFKDAIKDIARGDAPAQDVWERSLDHLRKGATIAGLGWNFTTSLFQPLGLSNSMVRIGPKWVASGIKQWMGSPFDAVEKVYAKSEMMRLRGETMNREIAEIRNKVSAGETGVTGLAKRGLEAVNAPKVVTENVVTARDWVEASMFYTIQKMQLVADIPTWLGQYEKSISEGRSDAEASALADQAVIDAQGGGQIKDLAGIQRGGPIRKLFTNFYSYFNVVHNLTAETHARTDYTDPASVALAARDYLLLYTVPTLLITLLRSALGGGDDEDTLVKKIINDQLGSFFGTLVGVRDILPAAASNALGVNPFPGIGYQGPAGLRFFSEAYKLSQQVGQGDMDKALRKAAINTAGILFWLPSGQINKTWDGTSAFLDGQAGPQALVTGP